MEKSYYYEEESLVGLSPSFVFIVSKKDSFESTNPFCTQTQISRMESLALVISHSFSYFLQLIVDFCIFKTKRGTTSPSLPQKIVVSLYMNFCFLQNIIGIKSPRKTRRTCYIFFMQVLIGLVLWQKSNLGSILPTSLRKVQMRQKSFLDTGRRSSVSPTKICPTLLDCATRKYAQLLCCMLYSVRQ